MALETSIDAVGRRRDRAGPRLPGRSWFYVAMGAVAVGIVLIGFGPGLTFSPTKRHGPPPPSYGSTVSSRRCGYRCISYRPCWSTGGKPESIGGSDRSALRSPSRSSRRDMSRPSPRDGGIRPLVGPRLEDRRPGRTGASPRRPALVQRPGDRRLGLEATVRRSQAPHAPRHRRIHDGCALAHFFSYFPALREGPPVILLPLAALYFSSAIYDRLAHGRIHPVSLWAGLSLLVWAMFRGLVIGPSASWHQFAGWLVSGP